MPATNYDKKIFRLLTILNKLDKGGKVFVKNLAEEFNVSVRSVQRDLNLLGEAGFPVDKAPETGAYIFCEGFQIGKSTLTEKEWALLLSFEDMAKKIGSPFDGLMRSIVQKNLHPPAVCDWFYFKVEESASVPDMEGLLSVLIDAIRNQEIITFTYSVYSEYQARVKPFKIIQFSGFWYLLGENTKDQVIKKYALDRIKKPKGTGKYFTEVPADLDKTLDESFNVWFGPKRGKKVLVEVSEEIADYFRRRKWFHNQKIIEEKKNGNLIISYLVSDYREILPFLKSWIPNLWVIKPKELKKKLREDLEKGIKNYETGFNKHANRSSAKDSRSLNFNQFYERRTMKPLFKILNDLNEHYWTTLQKRHSISDLIDQDSWIDALIHFCSYAFERAGSPATYREAAEKAFKQNQGWLEKRNHWSDNIEQKIWETFTDECNKNGLENYNVKNNPMSPSDGEQISMVHFAWHETEYQSIAKWAANCIKNDNLESAFEKLKKIRGVGSKIASFYLRDIYILSGNANRNIRDRHLLQPIDVWTRRAAQCLLSDQNASDQECAKFLIDYEDKLEMSNGTSNIAFWVLGSQIADDEKTFVNFVEGIKQNNPDPLKGQLEKMISEWEEWLTLLEKIHDAL